MKAIGIKLRTNEVIVVVLEKDTNGIITQSHESEKYKIDDPTDTVQVRQFQNQINIALNSAKPDLVAFIARAHNAKGRMAPSAMSFKWEGILQLITKHDIGSVSPQTLSAFFKKNKKTLSPNKKLEEDAFNLAYYLLEK